MSETTANDCRCSLLDLGEGLERVTHSACPVHGKTYRAADHDAARVRDEAVEVLREIADENHPLWDSDAWPFADHVHRLAQAFFAAHPELAAEAHDPRQG